MRERDTQRAAARDRIEAFEIADLALAENEDAACLQVLVKAGEREPGLLNVRAGDDAVETFAAREQLERQAGGLGTASQQRADRHAGDGSH